MGFLDGYKRYDTSEGYGNRKEWKKTFYQRMSPQEAEEILNESKKKGETAWDILGLKVGIYTAAAIKSAFREKLMEWHPDRNQHRIDEATEMSKQIIAAYTKLKI